ncbi:hypothetical protein K438DRAFT_2051327 [Mycena galopus ATCC 62051]|nr:hypothetical protein K438DRAFT_2051327 [Mycena galopus ATCC 62051]
MDRKHVVIALLPQCTDDDVKSHKKWLRLSPELARNPAYNASNAVEWISPDKYNDFLMYKERAAAENTHQNTIHSCCKYKIEQVLVMCRCCEWVPRGRLGHENMSWGSGPRAGSTAEAAAGGGEAAGAATEAGSARVPSTPIKLHRLRVEPRTWHWWTARAVLVPCTDDSTMLVECQSKRVVGLRSEQGEQGRSHRQRSPSTPNAWASERLNRRRHHAGPEIHRQSTPEGPRAWLKWREQPRTPDLSELETARRNGKVVYRAAAGGSDALTLQSPLLIE